jgi:hypothetical protein
MSGMRSLNGASDSQSVFSRKRSHCRIVEIDSWMSNEIHVISATVDRARLCFVEPDVRVR